MTQKAATRFAGANGLSIAADAIGDPSAPPVLFVHGGGQTRRAWDRGAEMVAAAGFRAIAIDTRGHGESEWAPDGDYSHEAVAADLVAIMRALARPTVLVGASRGGYAALIAARGDVAGRYAARALLLVEIAARIDPAGRDQVLGFMRASAQGFGDVGEAAALLSAYMLRPSSAADPRRLRRVLREGQDGRLYWHWDPRIASGSGADPARVEAALDGAARALACPVLLIRGALSELVKEAHVAHFRQLVPHAEVASIPGARHMVSGDENDAFSAAIVAYLRRLPPATGAG